MNSLSIMFKLFFLYDDIELSTYEKADKHILLFVFIGIAFFPKNIIIHRLFRVKRYMLQYFIGNNFVAKVGWMK